MSPLAFLCPVGFWFVGLTVAGLLGFLAYRKGQMPRRTAEVPRCRVAELRDGLCKVKGRLVSRGGEVLTSPLTGKRCLFYHFEVSQAYLIRTWTDRGGILKDAPTSVHDSESYRPLVRDSRSVSVVLEDDTGTALLDLAEAEGDTLMNKTEAVIDTSKPENVAFDLMLQDRYGCSTLVGRRANQGGGAARDPLSWKSWASEGREQPKARVCEEVIEEGIEVFVVGEVETRGDRPPRFRPVDHPLIVTTRPKEARLPPPANPATPLWIASGIVIGLTLLFTLVGILLVAVNLR